MSKYPLPPLQTLYTFDYISEVNIETTNPTKYTTAFDSML